MVFTEYDTVVMTWYQRMHSEDMANEVNGYRTVDGTKYEGRLLIAQFNVANDALDFYQEQGKYFGQGSALAYGHWGPTESNIYLGGAADNNRVNDFTEAV